MFAMCDWNYIPAQPQSWYYPQLSHHVHQMDYNYLHCTDFYSASTSSRQQRNQAEKNRRDKLNQSISTLASLVVPYTSSGKKVDKTSVLRLSANFLMRHMHLKENEQLAVPSEWCQKLLDELQGMLLVVSSSGKIIFWSENVESFLGHQQNDLLGQSLFDVTHQDDRMELEQNLKPGNFNDTKTGKIVDLNYRHERRNFFLRLKQRPATKSDQPQYEVFHVEGHIRYRKQLQCKIKNENGVITNESIFVAFVRSHKQRSVCDNSLLEALKEEWVTRHLLDGTIIFSDHRISFLSGYLSEEVTGNLAFTYMHIDDVRWVMIALRKMFSQNDSYGWSCYRLQSKNGDYIYLKTYGFLEKNEKGKIESFICINNLVTPEEGEKYIAEMRTIYTPVIYKSEKKELSVPAITETKLDGNPVSTKDCEDIEMSLNPKDIKLGVELLFSGLSPTVMQEVSNSSSYESAPKTHCQDITSVEASSQDLEVKLSNLAGKYDRPSVITSVSATERIKRSPESLEETEAKRLRGNKSVIVSDTRSQLDKYSLDTNFFFSADLFDSASTSFLQFSDDDPLRIPVDVTSSDLWDTPDSDLEEGVLRGHMHLENRIQSQGVQIQDIEEDLETVPFTSSHVYQNHFTHLKAEHRKQQELLKTLQQDHQRQQTKEHISLRGTEQNIGV